MPTNQKRTTRTRTGGGAEIAAAAAYFDRTYLLGETIKTWGSGKTEADIRDFWEKNREALMAESSKRNKEAGRPFQRPFPFWDWEKHPPRLKVGRERWMGPLKGPEPRKWHVEAIYEDDADYLIRLGLAEDWEIKKKEKKDHERKRRRKDEGATEGS